MWFITQLLNIGELQYTTMTVISSGNKVGKAIHLRNRFPLRQKRAEFCVKFAGLLILEEKKSIRNIYFLLFFFPLNSNESF